MVLGST